MALRAWPIDELKTGVAMRNEKSRSGFVWVLAEPVPGYPPGTKVTMPTLSIFMSSDTQEGGRSALVAVGALIVRVCEVPQDELDYWALDRCSWLCSESREWHDSAKEQLLFNQFDFSMGATQSEPLPQKFLMPPAAGRVKKSSVRSKTPPGSPNQSPNRLRPKTATSRSKTPPASRGSDSKATEDLAKMPRPSAKKLRTNKMSTFLEDEDMQGEIVMKNSSSNARQRAATAPASNQDMDEDYSPVPPITASVSLSSPELQAYQPQVNFLTVVTSPTTTLDRYLETVVMEVLKLLKADRCSIFFVDEVRKELWCIKALDIDPINLPWGHGIVGRVAIEGRMVNLKDAHTHPSFDSTMEKMTGYATRSLLAIPIKHVFHRTRTIGVMQVLNKQGGPDAYFSHEDVMEVQKIAMLIGDSFNRQRWVALQRGETHGDSGASSLIAHNAGRWQNPVDARAAPSSQNIFAVPSAPTDGRKALESFRWPETTLRTLQFNVFEYSATELVQLVPIMMENTGCVNGCGIPANCLSAWATAAQGRYRSNPFHSWFHAFSVFQMCYHQIYVSSISNCLRFLDVLGLLAAALCHDLDHPGFTNSFLVQMADDLALRYNDISVLENHHAALACELLRGEGTQIGSGLDTASQRTLRRIVIRCILDTDMAHHGDLCQKIVGLGGVDHSEDMKDISPESRDLLLSICVHSSDLSGQVFPWALAKKWEDCIAREFVTQAEAETAAGYTPAPFMQFSLDDVKKRAKLQRDFLDFVLVPLWSPYSEILSQLRPCYDNLVTNRASWHHRFQHGQDAEETELDTVVS